ncbi:uncharacterized protein LOC121233523 [Aquila chrysaetos chrysaetos]|uniref:uncharacterized protein LOC121233523 n=1 Tax=Aquila chrysaetos chrysaetos TaxID=223781 RepID=UPI001B7D2A7D|nr:uncharacterized protein LOC121233523 [Aquila chrysaetos chrysaetos]
MGPGGEKSSGSCPHIQSRSLGDSGMLLCALKSDYSTHPASGKAAAIARQAEMWYTKQEGIKHSNKLCCMLACPSLAHGSTRPHQARLWVVPRSTCCPAACKALPAPLLTPEAGAATGVPERNLHHPWRGIAWYHGRRQWQLCTGAPITLGGTGCLHDRPHNLQGTVGACTAPPVTLLTRQQVTRIHVARFGDSSCAAFKQRRMFSWPFRGWTCHRGSARAGPHCCQARHGEPWQTGKTLAPLKSSTMSLKESVQLPTR